MADGDTRQKRYIGSPALAKRYSRAVRTIARWTKSPPPGFPLPIKINDRNLWDLDAIEAYEAATFNGSEAA